MNKLDKTDLKVLAELEQDARQSLSQIAKKLNTSQQVISYRLKSLEQREVIGEYYTIINIASLGYTSYRTMIRFSNINPQKHEEVISYLKKHPNVLWIVDCGGRWDLLINFNARNVIHYNKILRELKKRFPEQIQNCDILTIVEVIYFGRNYFEIKKNNLNIKPDLYLGREEKYSSPDKIDLEILSLIAEQARITAVEISQKIDISPNTAILRIKQMKKRGLIQGFKPLIHLEKTAYSGYKALIRLQNNTEEAEKKMFNYLKTKINTVGIIRLIGSWDLEIEMEVKNKEEMLELTREIRDNFKEIIKEFEVIPLFKEYRYNCFPRDLLDK